MCGQGDVAGDAATISRQGCVGSTSTSSGEEDKKDVEIKELRAY